MQVVEYRMVKAKLAGKVERRVCSRGARTVFESRIVFSTSAGPSLFVMRRTP